MKIINRNKEDKDLPSNGRVGRFASTRMTGLYTRTEILRGRLFHFQSKERKMRAKMSELMTNQTIKHALLGHLQVRSERFWPKICMAVCTSPLSYTTFTNGQKNHRFGKLFIGIGARDTCVYSKMMNEPKFVKKIPEKLSIIYS